MSCVAISLNFYQASFALFKQLAVTAHKQARPFIENVSVSVMFLKKKKKKRYRLQLEVKVVVSAWCLYGIVLH